MFEDDNQSTSQPPQSGGDAPAIGNQAASRWPERLIAGFEVIICSDYPTQMALAVLFAAVGFQPFDPGHHLRVSYVVLLSLIDTAALIGLIFFFLHAHHERPRDVLLGSRRAWPDVVLGLMLVSVAFFVGVTVLAVIQKTAPSLHTVARNPLEDLIRRGRDAWLFALVVVVAGGVREEIQRAFLLSRFTRSLGGPWIGVLVTSAAFGAGHLVQGRDAAIATGTLGALWAVVYLARGSVLAPMVSHAGFDLIEILAGRMLP